MAEIFVWKEFSEVIRVTEHQCQIYNNTEIKLSQKEEIKNYIEKTGRPILVLNYFF